MEGNNKLDKRCETRAETKLTRCQICPPIINQSETKRRKKQKNVPYIKSYGTHFTLLYADNFNEWGKTS